MPELENISLGLGALAVLAWAVVELSKSRKKTDANDVALNVVKDNTKVITELLVFLKERFDILEKNGEAIDGLVKTVGELLYLTRDIAEKVRKS